MIYSKRHKVSIAALSKPKSKRDMITMRKIPVPEELAQNIPSVQLAVSKLKDFASNTNYGVIAQEVKSVLPELLSTQATVGWNMGPNILATIKGSSYVRVPDNDRSC